MSETNFISWLFVGAIVIALLLGLIEKAYS